MENVETAKYVRKPLYVDAVQVTEENFKAVVNWAQGDIGSSDAESSAQNLKPEEIEQIDTTKHYIRIRVHNPKSPRQTKAFVGDWILYTDRGYKIYTDKAFKDNFNKVESDDVAASAA